MKTTKAFRFVILLIAVALAACASPTQEPTPTPTVAPATPTPLPTPTPTPVIPVPVVLLPDAMDALALFTTHLAANPDLSARLEERYGYSLDQPGVILAAGEGPCFWIPPKTEMGFLQKNGRV